MSMADTTQQPPREILAQARARNAALQAKGLAAQRIGRGLVAVERDDVRATSHDIALALVRCLALVKDMMALSTDVVTAYDSALADVDRERGEKPGPKCDGC